MSRVPKTEGDTEPRTVSHPMVLVHNFLTYSEFGDESESRGISILRWRQKSDPGEVGDVSRP